MLKDYINFVIKYKITPDVNFAFYTVILCTLSNRYYYFNTLEIYNKQTVKNWKILQGHKSRKRIGSNNVLQFTTDTWLLLHDIEMPSEKRLASQMPLRKEEKIKQNACCFIGLEIALYSYPGQGDQDIYIIKTLADMSLFLVVTSHSLTVSNLFIGVM